MLEAVLRAEDRRVLAPSFPQPPYKRCFPTGKCLLPQRSIGRIFQRLFAKVSLGSPHVWMHFSVFTRSPALIILSVPLV